jgi:hypothetical protein
MLSIDDLKREVPLELTMENIHFLLNNVLENKYKEEVIYNLWKNLTEYNQLLFIKWFVKNTDFCKLFKCFAESVSGNDLDEELIKMSLLEYLKQYQTE